MPAERRRFAERAISGGRRRTVRGRAERRASAAERTDPVAHDRNEIDADAEEDARREDQLDSRADQKREERAQPDVKRLPDLPVVVDEFADERPDEGAQDDRERRIDEQPDDGADRGSECAGARTAEEAGHVGREEVVGRCDGDRRK